MQRRAARQPARQCQALPATAPPASRAIRPPAALEAVELDAPGDACHAGLAGLASGEVAGLFALAGAGPVMAVADEEPGAGDFQQERGERQARLVRG